MDDNFCKDSSKLLRQFAESQNTAGLFSLCALNFSPVAILGNACYNMADVLCLFSFSSYQVKLLCNRCDPCIHRFSVDNICKRPRLHNGEISSESNSSSISVDCFLDHFHVFILFCFT